MPMESVIVLIGIVVAFATFAAVVAWAERQTHRIN